MPDQNVASALENLEIIENSNFAVSTSPYIISVGLSLAEATNEETVATVRPDCNGLRIQKPGDQALYLIDRGQKRHIPNPDTFNNLFRNWSHVEDLYIFDSIETGPPLPDGAILAAAIGSGAVYLLDLGCKRHVTGPSVMKKYNFNWDRVYKLPPLTLANIPLGDPIA
jgi:hypothetical protein